jgi:hypothetical protein
VKRAISGTPVGVTQAQVQFYQQIWYLDCADANDNLLAEFAFYNGKDDQIAGQYVADGQYAMVMVVPAAGDTVKATGAFSIAYVEQGAQYPKYHVVASGLKDSLNREFDFDFTAEIFAYDYMNYMYCTYYQLNCDAVEIELGDAPVVVTGDTIRHTIELPADLADYTAGDSHGDKWFQFIANDEAYQVSICVNSDHLIGSFTAKDVDTQYTGAYDLSSGSAAEIKIDSICGISVAQNGDTIFAYIQFLGRDGSVYEFAVKNFTPGTTEEKTVELWGMQIDDTYLDYYGTVDFVAANASDTVSLSVYVNQDYAGSYTLNDVDTRYSNIVVGGVSAANIHSAEFSISTIGDSGFQISGDFLAKDGVLYHITMHTGWPEGIENAEAEVKAFKKLEEGALIIEKNGVKYNAQGAILK